LVMGTRSGDLDPAIHQFVINKEGSDIDEFTRILNKESGMLGLTEKSNDMREIIEASRNGDEECRTALKVYCYRLKKYIGAYLAALNGADVVIFTGGAGENSDLVRENSAGSLDSLGIELERERNLNMNGKEGKISRDSSKVEVYVIPTNEELVIARDTHECVSNAG
jgi:acetate kinase